MVPRRRRFATAALVVLMAQLTAVCGVPLAACAASPAAAHHESVDCCPPGSHAPGQCPLHKRESASDHCRMTCARQGVTPFVPGIVGVLPVAMSVAPIVASGTALFAANPVRISLTLPPAAPPPKAFA
jgi:hypothetical protein